MINCLFCKIVSGEQDRSIIYENDSIIAFMPLLPSHDGHVLVMPKTHYQDFCRIPDNELSQIFQATRIISDSLRSLYTPPKVAIYSMGLEIEHAHLHLIPVFDPYDLTSRAEYERTIKAKSHAELDYLSSLIREGIQHARFL